MADGVVAYVGLGHTGVGNRWFGPQYGMECCGMFAALLCGTAGSNVEGFVVGFGTDRQRLRCSLRQAMLAAEKASICAQCLCGFWLL